MASVLEVFNLKPFGSIGLTGKVSFPMFLELPERVQRVLENIGIGIEVEVEKTGGQPFDVPRYWEVHKDPSLRDQGLEFVTVFGVKVGHAPSLLRDLYLMFAESRRLRERSSFVFSERTSVHIHLDVRRLNMEQIENFLILYTLFEDSLFKYVSPEREHSIYCTPIRSTVPHVEAKSVKELVKSWGKYSALNILTLAKYGTFEFRHMQGTDDPDYIFCWICLLGLLYYAAMKMSNQQVRRAIDNIKCESHYQVLIDQIFFSFAPKIIYDPQEIDSAASDAKMFYFQNTGV